MFGSSVRALASGEIGKGLVTACQVLHETHHVALLYMHTSAPVTVEALGGGLHPSLMVSKTGTGGTQIFIEFPDFGPAWEVFSAGAEKSGVKITMWKPEA
jgi:hypothetical protein